MGTKILKIFIAVIAITLLISQNSYASNVIDDKDESIESVLIGYLSNSLEEQKELKEITNNYIVPNSNLSKYDKLQSKLLVNWYKEIGVKIKSYSVDIRINSIKKTGDIIRIDLDNIVRFQYEKADFNSGYTDNHVICLSKYGDSLLVEKDIFETDVQAQNIENELFSFEGSDGYEKYISNKIKILESREATFDKDINDFKNQTNNNLTNVSIAPLSVTYNASAAANWALNHVYDAEEYPGGDCTNFVSKALSAGGLPTDGTWYQGSNAWIRVIELRDWLINKGYATQYSSYSYAQLGDVIQYKNASNGLFTHSVIVTARDGWSEYPYISAHTSARYNVLASVLYPNSTTFSGYRVLDVHGN